jgi:hypothetical protein
MSYSNTGKTATARKPRYPSSLPIPAPLIAALYEQAAETGQSVTDLAAILIARGLAVQAQGVSIGLGARLAA